ncbi:MAG: histidine kinase [Chitinophagaceae bacterium]
MKSTRYSRKWVVVLIHAIAWTLLFSLPYLLRPSYNESQPASSGRVQGNVLVPRIMDLTWVIFFYVNALILIPRFIYKKKYWPYTILQLLILAWVITQASVLFKAFIPAGQSFNLRRILLFNTFVYLFILASSTAYQMIRDKLKADTLAKEKENENLKTELSLLRSQVSPHFMFNVLNNMVSLARKQSDLLEPSLIKLSSLMRYMLYEADEDKVSLEKEIEYLRSYIDLQQQRFGKKLAVNISLNVVDDNYLIEPMLFIPFVENAFKHGTGLIENPQIDVELKAEKNKLQFTVRNKFSENREEVKDKTSGIGLNNVKRRLNLLYGRNHNLLIDKSDNWFNVSLQIVLA